MQKAFDARAVAQPRLRWASPPIQGIYALAVALVDPASETAYDARRFGEAFHAAGSGQQGLVDVAWTCERTGGPRR